MKGGKATLPTTGGGGGGGVGGVGGVFFREQRHPNDLPKIAGEEKTQFTAKGQKKGRRGSKQQRREE